MTESPSNSESPDTARPRQTAGAFAALYLGAFLAVMGGYFHLDGFETPDYRPISTLPAAASALLEPIGEDAPVTPVLTGPPTLGETLMMLLSRDSDSTSWLFVLGCVILIWGLWTLQKLHPKADPTSDYLRCSFRDGADPSSLHTEEALEEMRQSVASHHQRKVLWSLPFWFTTLILLIVNGGTLGNQTILGLSDLWLIAITLGVYFLYIYLHWRCPACNALLPKHDERLTCDKCGLSLNTTRSAPAEKRFY